MAAKQSAFEAMMGALQADKDGRAATMEDRARLVAAMENEAVLLQEMASHPGWLVFANTMQAMREAKATAMEQEVDSIRLHRLAARAATLGQLLMHVQGVIDAAQSSRNDYEAEKKLIG